MLGRLGGGGVGRGWEPGGAEVGSLPLRETCRPTLHGPPARSPSLTHWVESIHVYRSHGPDWLHKYLQGISELVRYS